jgi:hypothetical protein
MADRSQRLLQVYALIEFALGLASAGVTLGLASWETWVALLAPWIGPESSLTRPLTVLASAFVLIVPTCLMGATLPVLAAHQSRGDSVIAGKVGLLYGINTLGGAIGCSLAAFALIGWLGVTLTGLLASLTYVLIAIGAAQTVRLVIPTDHAVHGKHLEADTTVDSRPMAASAGGLLGVFFLMGFVSIAYEVLWFRLLTYFGIHTVYAFAGMLTTFLMGLVLGAMINTSFLARQRDRHISYLAHLQVMIVAAVIVSLAMLGRSRNLLLAIEDVERRVGVADYLAGLTLGMSPFLSLCMIVLLLPCTLIGIGFPLAMEMTTRQLDVVGSRLGLLYSVNTLGAYWDR